MKKILFFAMLLMTTSIYANDPPIDEKVSKIFSHAFPNAASVNWVNYTGHYEVLFKNYDVNCRIIYDLKGNIISARRDYYEKDLPLMINAKIKDKFPNKNIYGVTEVTSNNTLKYYVILEDASTWTTVKASECGDLLVVKKYKKA